VITDYLFSVGDLYGPALNQPWPVVVAAVGRQVPDVIDREGHFLTRVAHPAAALCSPVQRSPGLRERGSQLSNPVARLTAGSRPSRTARQPVGR
jgi:hypothetical protein